MFRSVLIANRGEIACRIIATAKRTGLRTIAVYSSADADARHVRLADEAHLIGPAPAAQSYLGGQKILAMAKSAGADCIHPGYGFLSENTGFAQDCADAGITFIGPPPAAIKAMGLKDEAKEIMRAAGVPVVPGYDGAEQDDAVLAREADAITYPILIKAVAGGGGKGMRIVESAQNFSRALDAARREAKAAFGNDRVLVEKFVAAPRHIEMQVIADGHGNVLHLNERDCSLQRRHQKVIEEAPAPFMNEQMRAAMGKAAVEAARAVGYVNAGTVEFIVDGSADGANDFYFMEMNTRLQVEHPVTEAITGLDLVELQLKVAAGETLPLVQKDVAINGHAIEARLYAEDPRNDFLPSTGTIAHLRWPDGVRIDTGVEQGAVISPHYDPMIAKIIAHGKTRDDARQKLQAALAGTLVAGPKTNVSFLHAVTMSPSFHEGRYDTGALAKLDWNNRTGSIADRTKSLAAFALLENEMSASLENDSPWAASDGFQLSGPRRQRYDFLFDGMPEQAQVAWQAGEPAVTYASDTILRNDAELAAADGEIVSTLHGLYLREGLDFYLTTRAAYDTVASSAAIADSVFSPMHGKVIAISVGKGDAVTKGQPLAIVEAMKMEHVLTAPRDGIVETVYSEAGAQVSQGTMIVALQADKNTSMEE